LADRSSAVGTIFIMKESLASGVFYRAFYKFWRQLPDGMRGAIYRSRHLNSLKASGRDLLAKFAGRDDIYNNDYYQLVDEMALRSVGPMATSLVDEFAPKSFVDVGCGTGAMLASMARLGVPGFGLEYSEAALEACRKRGLQVEKFDLTRDANMGVPRCDLVVSTEVAEHISAEYADRLVGLISGLADIVFFTAATPGQGGGTDHVNEQPHDYWIQKFAVRSFVFDHVTSLRWRDKWREQGVEGCYWQNAMVFRRREELK
jgi:SAM-dependent methyltransferase